MKYIIYLLNFLIMNTLATSQCNFKSNSYCGSFMGIINNLEISHLNDNYYNISAKVFEGEMECSNETLTCSNNSVIYSKNSSDCLNKKLNSYGIDLKIKYNDTNNFIDIFANFVSFELKSC